ncbi:MoaD/ThiS family protein [Ferrimicrobium sp.]|uniref:MoaD/ThiS family protein n=1 Tax=Ferrimicrobium sp. TaxID=2926050 RepID=UPI00261C7403|nr:MoaD/ThiS family protein [Ferrimicrobium sp.]
MMLVRFFGNAKAVAGADTVEIEVSAETVADFVEQLGERCGDEMKALLPYCRLAHGTVVLDAKSAMPTTGEIVVLPPVSGG